MKQKLLTVSLLLFTSCLFSQQRKIDSLTREFNKAETDTAKAHILSDIGILAYRIDLNYAKKINDSLINFSTGRTDKWLIQGYRMQGTFNLLEGDYKSSENYYTKALQLAEKIDDAEQEASLLANFGTFYGRQGEREKAKEFYLKAIKVNNERNHNPKLNIRPYINLAITVGQTNEFELAVKYLIKALEIAEQNGSTQTAYIHNELAKNFLKLDQYEKAEFHLKKALPIAEEQGDSYALATIHNSLGYLYETRDENYKKTLYHYEKSLFYYSILNNKRDMANAYLNTGLQYQRLQNFNKAKESLEKGIRMADSLNAINILIDGTYYLATLYAEQGNIDKANTLIKKANTYLGNDSKMNFRNHYFRLAKAFEKNKNYFTAFKNMDLYTILSDSLFKVNGTLKIAEIETKYQTEKKEKENLSLKQQNVEQALQTEKEKTQKLILGSGFSISIAALGIFFLFYRKNKKQKREIEKQKDLVEKLQRELHHRLKNNLSFIDFFITLAKGKFPDPAYREKLDELQNRINSMFEVHRQLFKKEDVTSVNAKTYISALVENVKKAYALPNITLEENVADTDLRADTSFPIGLIVNEFVTNSYKYAFPNNEKGIISINLKEENDQYLLRLADNGKGLPKDFDIENLNSFGMETIKLLTQEYKGSFKLDGFNGTRMDITFPKNAA